MLYVKAFHIIAVIAWFAGLFYLPRLFVYHADARDTISCERFCIMERRLYYAIMWPAAVLTTVLGIMLMTYNLPYYTHVFWMHAKLASVLLIWAFHFYCGHCVKRFAKNDNQLSSTFYRICNEVPTVFLIVVVLLVVVKPS